MVNADDRYRHIDVAAVQPDHSDPEWRAMRVRAIEFLAEHRHAEDEVRLFVAGRACFDPHLEPDTTSPTDSVREKLDDYTRSHLRPWLVDNQGRAAKPVIAESRELSGRVDASPAEVAEILFRWLIPT